MFHIRIGSSNHKMMIMQMNIFESAFVKALCCIEYQAGRKSGGTYALDPPNVVPTLSQGLQRPHDAPCQRRPLSIIRGRGGGWSTWSGCVFLHIVISSVLSLRLPALLPNIPSYVIRWSVLWVEDVQTRNTGCTLSPTSVVVCLPLYSRCANHVDIVIQYKV